LQRKILDHAPMRGRKRTAGARKRCYGFTQTGARLQTTKFRRQVYKGCASIRLCARAFAAGEDRNSTILVPAGISRPLHSGAGRCGR
jgi:hypothetical protein